MEKERKDDMIKLAAIDQEIINAELNTVSKSTSFTEKLYCLSLSKPRLWRAMKEKELLKRYELISKIFIKYVLERKKKYQNCINFETGVYFEFPSIE